MSLSRSNWVLWGLCISIVGLAVANWSLTPSLWWKWSIPIALAGCAPWIGRGASSSRARKLTLDAQLIAGLIIAAALGLKYLEALEAGERMMRLAGVLFGILLVASGNALPKRFASCICAVAAGSDFSLQRHLGWIQVTAGLAFIGCWILLSGLRAMEVASVISLVMMGLIASRLIWSASTILVSRRSLDN